MKKKSTLFGTGLIIGMCILIIVITIVLAMTNTTVISGSDSLNKFLTYVNYVSGGLLRLWLKVSTWSCGVFQQMLQQIGQLTSKS